MTITLAGIPPERLPAASGLSNFARITAGAFGTSVATTLWERQAAVHHVELSERLDSGNVAFEQAIADLQASGLSLEQALAAIDRLVNQQAYTMSVDDIFPATAVLFPAMIPLVWLGS